MEFMRIQLFNIFYGEKAERRCVIVSKQFNNIHDIYNSNNMHLERKRNKVQKEIYLKKLPCIACK